MQGYAYQSGLDDIRRAYNASMNALHTQLENAQSDLIQLRRRVDAGEQEAYERDDDGDELYRHDALQELLIQQATDTLPIARSSYVLILLHYWEKSVDRWMQKSENFTAKCLWLNQIGLIIDKDGLKFLRLVANTIKHNSDQLFIACPEIFRSGFLTAVQPNYADALLLTDQHVDAMFDAVQASGCRSTVLST